MAAWSPLDRISTMQLMCAITVEVKTLIIAQILKWVLVAQNRVGYVCIKNEVFGTPFKVRLADETANELIVAWDSTLRLPYS